MYIFTAGLRNIPAASLLKTAKPRWGRQFAPRPAVPAPEAAGPKAVAAKVIPCSYGQRPQLF